MSRVLGVGLLWTCRISVVYDQAVLMCTRLCVSEENCFINLQLYHERILLEGLSLV